MEELGVGIAVAEVTNFGSLTLAGPFKRCKSLYPTFQIGTEPTFIFGESTGFLNHIQLKDDVQGHKELKLAVGEETLAPRSEPLSRGLKLVAEDMGRLSMR
jgi:hypothetical protein